ncbi:hypothetical protein WICPIJ_003568 [Wickerhamomyces pijperi]|uniref:Survival factor 1 n=1 Tax=Wickerhamomyces pijperi TaxID=599730 RepID=A0A9P8Q7D1_WICPI|nr:hypothetical protein WICPIJ_003568 [Wickerhamomyces pijperi]
MLKWVQSGISAVTGMAEPEYGPEYIHSITDTVKDKQPFTEATAEDFKWQKPESTNVETQTFYFTDLNQGLIGFAQVIHSNIIGMITTAQFTFKIYNTKTAEQIWTSTKLEDFVIKGANIYAKNLSIELSEDGSTFHIVSKVNPESEVDLTITKVAPAAKIGKDGTTIYGDNIEEPWGTMRHVFWPRNTVTGEIKSTKEGSSTGQTFKIDGKSMFVMAMQGMKPHHAAAKWNFLNFQGEKASVVLMEFTTPKSYASTTVSVAFVSSDEGIIATSVKNDCKHLNTKPDGEVGWDVPQALEFDLHGVNTSNEPVEAKITGDLILVERVDVMAEIPQFVKNIVSGVAGTKPYVYQFWNDFTLEVGDIKETSIGYAETTFITLE